MLNVDILIMIYTYTIHTSIQNHGSLFLYMKIYDESVKLGIAVIISYILQKRYKNIKGTG